MPPRSVVQKEKQMKQEKGTRWNYRIEKPVHIQTAEISELFAHTAIACAHTL